MSRRHASSSPVAASTTSCRSRNPSASGRCSPGLIRVARSIRDWFDPRPLLVPPARGLLPITCWRFGQPEGARTMGNEDAGRDNRRVIRLDYDELGAGPLTIVIDGMPDAH